MLLAFLIYLAEVAGKIHSISGWFIILSILAMVVLGIYSMVSHTDGNEIGMQFGKRSLKCFLIVLIVSAIVNVVTPRSNTMYLMAGAYIGTEAVKSPDVSDKLSKISKIIDYKLDDLLDELKEKSESKSSKSSKSED